MKSLLFSPKRQACSLLALLAGAFAWGSQAHAEQDPVYLEFDGLTGMMETDVNAADLGVDGSATRTVQAVFCMFVI